MIYHRDRLVGVHPTLEMFIRLLISKLETHWPEWQVLCGWRNQADQHAAFISGHSGVDWPNGAHNHMVKVDNPVEDGPVMLPDSLAVDLSPYPYDAGKDERRLYLVAGYAMRLADERGIKIRFGADWNSNFRVNDQSLHDPWHFELVE